MTIHKEDILRQVKSYNILNRYLEKYSGTSRLIAGQNFSNPFLATKQETPSFNIYVNPSTNEWRYKDFATDDEGSCFDLVMKLYSLSFQEALAKINVDFNLNLLDESNLVTTNFGTSSITTHDFNQSELSFWAKYGISSTTLLKYNVVAISSFKFISKKDKPCTINKPADQFFFGYLSPNSVKIYKPLSPQKEYKFQHIGEKEYNTIFGWDQLPSSGSKLFITGGEKDVMALDAKGFNAISLNSESAKISADIMDELKSRFTAIYVLYDIDATGIKFSNKLVTEHNLFNLTLPPIPNNGKDISDYYANGGLPDLEVQLPLLSANKVVFNADNAIKYNHAATSPKSINSTKDLFSQSDSSVNPPVEEEQEKVIFNAVELLAMGDSKPKFLMAPIFPQKGTGVIAGKPDTGKSQFARQLCIHISLGLKEFLGFELTPVHNRAIYVATEDNLEATQYLLHRQIKGVNACATENLRFIFADTLEQEEILTNLDAELTRLPSDLVVVDSYGDIFKGNDTNNNMAMRNTVKTFDKIAKKHNCCIIFVHHINKSAYRISPGQEHIQGGAGLMQKVRLGIILSEGDADLRYFTVVKGNYCPKEYKEMSMILKFSESNFLFTNTGQKVTTSSIGSQAESPKADSPKFAEYVAKAQEIFDTKHLTYGDFVKIYCDITLKSEITAKRFHKKLLELDIITKDKENKYYFTYNGSDKDEDLNSESDEIEQNDDF